MSINREPMRDSRPRRWNARLLLMLAPALLFICVFFVGGLLFAVRESLSQPLVGVNERAWTLESYRRLFADQEFYTSLRLTLTIAITATVLSTVIGFLLAYAVRRRAASSTTLSVLLQVPLAIPHLVVALLMLQTISPSGLLARLAFACGVINSPAGFPALIADRYGLGIIIAYTLKEAPFVLLVTLALLVRVESDYDELARTLGANRWQRLRHVALPLVAPGVFAASLVVFAFIFGAFETPYLLGRPYPSMLAVVAGRHFVSTDLTERPIAIAFALVITAISILIVTLYARLARRFGDADERPPVF